MRTATGVTLGFSLVAVAALFVVLTPSAAAQTSEDPIMRIIRETVPPIVIGDPPVRGVNEEVHVQRTVPGCLSAALCFPPSTVVVDGSVSWQPFASETHNGGARSSVTTRAVVVGRDTGTIGLFLAPTPPPLPPCAPNCDIGDLASYAGSLLAWGQDQVGLVAPVPSPPPLPPCAPNCDVNDVRIYVRDLSEWATGLTTTRA